MLICSLLVILCIVPPGWTYTVSYHDCTQPSTIQAYQTSTVCNQQHNITSEMPYKPVTILQQPEIHELTGHSCSIKKSSFYFKCGVWSHLKLGSVPKIGRHLSLTTNKCSDMINTLSYSNRFLPSGITLTMNEPIFYSVTEVGSLIEEDDAIKCIGDKFRADNGALHTDVVELAQYEVLIEQKTFLVKQSRIEVKDDHLSLSCHAHHRGCITGSSTYVWPDIPNSCKLNVINHLDQPMIVQDSYLLDHQHKILLNMSEEITVEGCSFPVRKTEYNNIFVTASSVAATLPPIQGRDVKLSVQSSVRLSYLSYDLETRFKQQNVELLNHMCSQKNVDPDRHTVRIDGDQYAMRRGDVFYVFKCVQRVEKIAESENCYADVPLISGKFVDINTRLLKDHSTQQGCNRRFPLIVQAEEAWVELLPHIKQIAAPLTFSPSTIAISPVEDFANSGLYTQSEINEWQHLLSFPSYREALLAEISLGNCIVDGSCPPQHSDGQLPLYSLTKLREELNEKLNIFKRVDKFIRLYGDYLAALVLLIFVFKFLMNFVLTAITLLRAGPAAATAILQQLCLSQKRKYNKILRQYRRADTAGTADEDMPLGTAAVHVQPPTNPVVVPL